MSSDLLISVIVPSYNQAAYLDATLDSIFSQGGVRTEVLVIDGGSTDGSVELIKRRADRLAWWESERDRGQSHAINKGLARIRGDAWLVLNSDDLLLPGALATLAEPLANPKVHWVCADAEIWREPGEIVGFIKPTPANSIEDLLTPWRRRGRAVFPFSGACLLRRSLYRDWGGFDEELHYSMDMEYYTRITLREEAPPVFLPAVVARWRWHEASKTHLVGRHHGFLREEIEIAGRYASFLDPEARGRLERDLREQRRWLAVARAVFPQANDTRLRRVLRLLREAGRNPSVIAFRPWLGALRASLTSARVHA